MWYWVDAGCIPVSHLISDISKLELESDFAADTAKTSLTKPNQALVLGVGATQERRVQSCCR